MTTVTVNTYTQSVTYVADNILKSLKDVIVMAGLDPTRLVDDWASTRAAVATWLDSGHLEKVMLEVFNPRDDALVTRWDIDVNYGWTGNGGFYTDTEQLRFHIRKAGVVPSQASYRLLLRHRPGEPYVEGWTDVTIRSVAGMARQSLGSTIEHNGLGASASYWRRN